MANKGFRAKDNYIFAIRNKQDLFFMGGIGLKVEKDHNRAELGYWLGEPFWKKGYTTEATTAIIKFGFKELQLNKIVATYIDTNLASGRIMVNNGMNKEATLKDHDIKNGKYVTLIQYGLTKKEYESL